MSQRHAIFLVNLLQDVSIVRPLVFLAARDLGLRTAFLVSGEFLARDKSATWQQELREIGGATGTPALTFQNEMQALQLLQDKTGILIAGSETNLSAHRVVHDVFRQAPASFVKITLQHGFECPGFLHNKAHDLAHGTDITFAADVLCGWSNLARLSALAPSQRSKLYVSGPPAALQLRRAASDKPRGDAGLVCENLHSVRLNVAGDRKSDFMEVFGSFCAALATDGRKVVLRPHPGGQYVLKNKITLPSNAIVNNHPMYKVDLTKYAYGISAPSSVLLDMMLAGIPVAVWRDSSGAIDARNYEGLAEIITARDWVDFSREAVSHPERFLERQRHFLARQQMPLEPAAVHERFASLFRAAARMSGVTGSGGRERERVLYVVNNDEMSTLQLSFEVPLAELVSQGEIATELLSEAQMMKQFREGWLDDAVRTWVDRRLAMFQPSVIVFSRYSGPHAEHMVNWARRAGVPVICHMDDDLLNVPLRIGRDKQKFHHEPRRLATVRYLLDKTDLLYCSTPRLKERFEALAAKSPAIAGEIYCAAHIRVPAVEKPVRKIGYMGFDKESELEMMLPVLVTYLRRHPEVDLEFFGFFTMPPPLEEFGKRIRFTAPIRNYEDFLSALASLNWDIGICPLIPTDFNLLKADTKWVEYTAVGAAVIASRGTSYDECCADGCGILVDSAEEWLEALEKLTADPAMRFAQVQRAQKRVLERYSVERLRDQVLRMFAEAKSLRKESSAHGAEARATAQA
jgi:glycosyltransferase involved in cell wall biosynthesis